MKKILNKFYMMLAIIMIILISCIGILSIWGNKKLSTSQFVHIMYLSDPIELFNSKELIQNNDDYFYLKEYQNFECKMEMNDVGDNDEIDKFDEIVNRELNLDDFNNKILKLQKQFPNGMYWNHADVKEIDESEKIVDDIKYTNVTEIPETYVSNVPCNHNIEGEINCNIYNGISIETLGFSYGTQCAGFTSLLSDKIFGEDAPITVFTDYDELRVGDQARINNGTHSVLIIDKTDDYVIVAECNSDYNSCKIEWGRKIERDNLNGIYFSRWSF